MTDGNPAIAFDPEQLRAWFARPDREKGLYDVDYDPLGGEGGYALACLLLDLTGQPRVWQLNGISQLEIVTTCDAHGPDGGIVATFTLDDGPLLTTGRITARDLVPVDGDDTVPALDAAVAMLHTLAGSINLVADAARTAWGRPSTGLTAEFTPDELDVIVGALAAFAPVGSAANAELSDRQTALLRRAQRVLNDGRGTAPSRSPTPDQGGARP